MYGAQTTNFGNAASGGLYGGGQFGYSLNLFSASVTSSNAGLFVSTSAAWSDINFDSALSASIATNSLTKIAIPQAAFSGSDANAVRSFTIAPAAANAVQFGDGEVLSNFTTVSASSVVFILNRTAPATPGQNANFVFYWNKSTDFNTRGDFEDRSGAPSVPNAYSPSAISIPEVNVGMRSETISAKRKI